MTQDVYIIGATGTVGSELVRQVFEKGDTDPARPNPTRVVGLASSTHTLYSAKGLTPEQSLAFAGGSHANSRAYRDLNELLGVGSNGRTTEENVLAFVDATALNEPMAQFHSYVIEETPHGLVTANKNPVALSDYDTFQELTQDPGKYGYRCTVMAGAEAVPLLQDLGDLNDTLHSIEGCFSGTLGYIASELENGGNFSEILREAKDQGYTEPDPRDDLSGLDVARKLVVLARTAGYNVGIGDVHIEPFIPQEYFTDESIDDFLARTTQLDTPFKDRMEAARADGQTLRYVAGMKIEDGTPIIEVSLKEVPVESGLGGLKGTKNKLVVVSGTYPDGYSVEAAGAGPDVTAQNIRRDLSHLLL